MLDAYIIDQIRREQEERDRRSEEGRRIRLELPIYRPDPRDQPREEQREEEPDRGPIVIPFGGNDDCPEEDAA